MEPDLKIQIDLYNLEDDKFEGSKYVLTSPRSLEACSRLNVKPVELLHKPLSEFQEELLPQDVPLRTIYAVFDESEQIRQQKLRLCREERNRIISADQKIAILDNKANMSSFLNHDRTIKKTAGQNQAGNKSTTRGKYFQGSVDNESLKLHRELLSKKERNGTQARQTVQARPQSASGRKTQRCSSSIALGQRVRFRCRSAPNDTYKLPARDEKILKLMQGRREKERRDLKLCKQAHMLWEDQKKREEALRIIAENKRRELLAEENRIKDMHRTEAHERRANQEEKEKEVRKFDIYDSQLRAETALMNQLRMRELQISDKIKKEATMKEIQETNIKIKEKEDEEMNQLFLAKQICNQNSVTERKEMKIHQESLNKFLGNRQEREKFEKRLRCLKNQQHSSQQSSDDSELGESNDFVRSSIEQRLFQARKNLSQIEEQRNQEMADKHQEEHVKLQRARSACRKLEAEMEAWRADLLLQEKLKEDRASKVVNRSTELKSWQARRNRILKQQEQKKNISRILKDDEKYRHELEKSLQLKDKKIEDMKDFKERTVAQTRAMAQLSQALRDDIKGKYETDTFDKKVLEAQLYASITREHRSRSPALRNRTPDATRLAWHRLHRWSTAKEEIEQQW